MIAMRARLVLVILCVRVLTVSTSAADKAFALIIKGPLLTFTVRVIEYYATRFGDETGIVFSHNNGTCYGARRATVLRELEAKHANFVSTIQPAPPELGHNFRNAQREATYHGVRLAVQAFRAKYVFMQRPDTVFQKPSMLTDLAALLAAQPPPAVPVVGGRVGICPFQTQFTDFYGRFALDDHCMFGAPEAVEHFWSTSNEFYRASAHAWSGQMNNSRHGCRTPGVESDNGFIWVMADARRGIPPPADTRELIAQRMFVINPEAWDHVCLRGKGNRDVRLPYDTTHNMMSFAKIRPAAPYGVFAQCTKQAQLYDCSSVGDVQARTDTPKWACTAQHTSACHDGLANEKG
jgi:hypothetical protein